MQYRYSRHSIIGALPFRARTAPIIECLLYLSNTSENKNNIKGAPFEELPFRECPDYRVSTVAHMTKCKLCINWPFSCSLSENIDHLSPLSPNGVGTHTGYTYLCGQIESTFPP